MKKFEDIVVGDIIYWKSIRQIDKFEVIKVSKQTIELKKITQGSRNDMDRLFKKDYDEAVKKGVIIQIIKESKKSEVYLVYDTPEEVEYKDAKEVVKYFKDYYGKNFNYEDMLDELEDDFHKDTKFKPGNVIFWDKRNNEGFIMDNNEYKKLKNKEVKENKMALKKLIVPKDIKSLGLKEGQTIFVEESELLPEKADIIIVVHGGLVQEVRSNKSYNIGLVDYDNLRDEGYPKDELDQLEKDINKKYKNRLPF